MPDLTNDEVISQKHKRNFVQFGGARPGNHIQYAGQDAQYIAIDGVTSPETGGIEPFWVHDHSRPGKFRLVGKSISAPDLPTATLTMLEKHGSLPRQLFKIGCDFNIYELTGECGDLSDFMGGWKDYVLIYSGATVTNKDLGTRSAWDSDDLIEDSLEITLSEIYPVGPLGFAEGAVSEVSREVVDIVYGNPQDCVGCDDGSNRIYAVTESSGGGSPGLPAEVIYSLDGGGVWSQVNIDSFGASENPLAIDIVGRYLVVLGADAYYYAEINEDTGIPGTFTKVTTGIVAAGTPVDMFVLNPREVFFVGDAGYIYKSTDITAGVTVINDGDATTENLKRVHGYSETLVAVGEAGTVIKSTNSGRTWAVTGAEPVNATLQALYVLDSKRYWVGTNGGEVWYTLNGGETWFEITFDGSGAGQVYDIYFPTNEVGYFSHSTATPTARVFATFDGGEHWTRSAQRILSFPTFDIANRLAAPVNSGDSAVAANNLAVAGLAGDGVDGIILIGVASRL